MERTFSFRLDIYTMNVYGDIHLNTKMTHIFTLITTDFTYLL